MRTSLTYLSITKPHLWPTATLQRWLLECRDHLLHHSTTPARRLDLKAKRAEVNEVIAARPATA
ncbi:hypothetical protein [Hymenobacter latericus]|uniref:hypothetical protein n=1 Tax=Hymenobacter sp. YIM 151858-1 TaxID=2987688 RepID=UPI002227055E|nr:hypothetical protein [Hymenobacter sp. YIM 151858-1]UYZ60152.1 hypothetical protein OIS50_04955 [Hymenobacter sp. YIM 151858-1]